MSKMTAWILFVLTVIAAVAAGAGWYQSRLQMRETRLSELTPMVALAKEDQALLEELKGAESGILVSYLAAIRADGVAKHADIKQRLDRLAESNAAILALINAYSARAKTAAFGAQADKFRLYAIAWRDRWNSVMELFMAGGNYPVAEVPFPKEFIGAVLAEIDAAQHII